MKIDHQVNSIVINRQANSLHSLIADGNYRSTSLGRDTWKKLIGQQASLQRNCNHEGFNCPGRRYTSIVKARIGIIGNQENNCYTPDSFIGFGTSFDRHYDNNTCGNGVAWGADNGDKNIKAMGYILVQWVYKCNVKNIVHFIVNDQCLYNANRNCRLSEGLILAWTNVCGN